MQIAGIVVAPDLAVRWKEWFAPPEQPFLVTDPLRATLGLAPVESISMELQDTYCLYGAETMGRTVMLGRQALNALSADVRSELLGIQVALGRRLVPTLRSLDASHREVVRGDGNGRRFVWWPETLRAVGDQVLASFVADDLLTSRHDQVAPGTWERASETLPRAQVLAGTFANRSGPNCFGTVMAAAGVPDAEDRWMLREPFEEWLSTATVPGGVDAEPGTVLVWRDAEGQVVHAAVTIGDGWALHKPSQGWMTPRKVLTVAEVKVRARRRGARLSRHTIGVRAASS